MEILRGFGENAFRTANDAYTRTDHTSSKQFQNNRRRRIAFLARSTTNARFSRSSNGNNSAAHGVRNGYRLAQIQSPSDYLDTYEQQLLQYLCSTPPPPPLSATPLLASPQTTGYYHHCRRSMHCKYAAITPALGVGQPTGGGEGFRGSREEESRLAHGLNEQTAATARTQITEHNLFVRGRCSVYC